MRLGNYSVNNFGRPSKTKSQSAFAAAPKHYTGKGSRFVYDGMLGALIGGLWLELVGRRVILWCSNNRFMAENGTFNCILCYEQKSNCGNQLLLFWGFIINYMFRGPCVHAKDSLGKALSLRDVVGHTFTLTLFISSTTLTLMSNQQNKVIVYIFILPTFLFSFMSFFLFQKDALTWIAEI